MYLYGMDSEQAIRDAYKPQTAATLTSLEEHAAASGERLESIHPAPRQPPGRDHGRPEDITKPEDMARRRSAAGPELITGRKCT